MLRQFVLAGICHTYRTMSGQAKISTFFQPLQAKQDSNRLNSNTSLRNRAEKVDSGVPEAEQEPPLKKLKTGNGAVTPVKVTCLPGQENKVQDESHKSVQLSPEQKQKAATNLATAKMKLTEKKTFGLVTNVGTTWYNALEAEFDKPYFLQLSEFVAAECKKSMVYPPVNDVFTWTKTCDIKDVKVVILGQDPYHGPQQAHGLCFSVQKGVRPPPSLENMFKELKNDIEGFSHPGHGNLTGWARQGVLLLNAVLTVRKASANAHQGKGWEKLTDAVVSWLNKNLSGVVFMLWGAYAQKKGACIDLGKHHVLKSVHPSPLSAHRGFLGCQHFSKCNELLREQGKKPIDWKDLPPC